MGEVVAPDGFVKCPRANCPRWMHPSRSCCWTCLGMNLGPSDVLPGCWDWTPPSLNAETTKLVEDVRSAGAHLNACLVVKYGLEQKLRDEDDKIQLFRIALRRAEDALRESLFKQVDAAKDGR